MAMAFESQRGQTGALQKSSNVPNPNATKTCPRCGAQLFADMDVCYGCLYDFSKPGLSYSGSGMSPENGTGGAVFLGAQNPGIENGNKSAQSAQSAQSANNLGQGGDFSQLIPGAAYPGAVGTPKGGQAAMAQPLLNPLGPQASQAPQISGGLPASQVSAPLGAPTPLMPSGPAPLAYGSLALAPGALVNNQPNGGLGAALSKREDSAQGSERLAVGLAVRWRGLEAVLSLASKAVTVGSGRTNDVTLYDFSLPAQCLRIQASSEGAVVELADPRTQALLDGLPLQSPTVLKPGQVLDLSGARFSLVRTSP